MKGLILAGGMATRLRPLTLVTNKHLLPIYNKPMIYYPLEAMQKAGIKEVLITSSPDHAGHFASLLKDGSDFNLRTYYAVQKEAGGISQAIKIAEDFARNEKLLVILGDNIFNFDLKSVADRFEKQERGAVVFGVKKDTESKQYGVIEMDENKRVISIEEKPEVPKSPYAQSGVYMYDHRVFDFIDELKPSERGELEVTDLNNKYLEDGSLSAEILDWWIDAGTSHDELINANIMVRDKVLNGEL